MVLQLHQNHLPMKKHTAISFSSYNQELQPPKKNHWIPKLFVWTSQEQ